MTDLVQDQLRMGVRLSDECLYFLRAMTQLQGSAFDVLYFLERPDKWAAEFSLWVDRDRPTSDSEAQWADFAEAVEAL